MLKKNEPSRPSKIARCETLCHESQMILGRVIFYYPAWIVWGTKEFLKEILTQHVWEARIDTPQTPGGLFCVQVFSVSSFCSLLVYTKPLFWPVEALGFSELIHLWCIPVSL